MKGKVFRAHKAKSPILLLRINLNIADIMTIFLFVPKQVIWILTYGVKILKIVNLKK